MALATHSRLLIAAYVIDTEHENNEFCRWLALQTCALIQEAPYWERKTNFSKLILEAILYRNKRFCYKFHLKTALARSGK